MKKYFFCNLILGIIFLSGCAAFQAAPLLMTTLTGGQAALTALDFNEAMKNVDYKSTIDAKSGQVWKAALATTEEMQIEVIEKAFDEKNGGGIITGKTGGHKKIQIIVVAVTPSITNVGIKARVREFFNMPITSADVDTTFAAIISQKIRANISEPRENTVQPSVTTAQIQQFLSDLGYQHGPVDGKIGKKTIAALKKFQKDNNLPATGKIDNVTVSKLREKKAEGRGKQQVIQQKITVKAPQKSEAVKVRSPLDF